MSETPKSSGAFYTADHKVLFEDVEPCACDVCGGEVMNESVSQASESERGGEDAGFGIPGRGLLVWFRGDERRFQEPPLCSSCAVAVGMTALSRWETEEDEG